MKAKREAAQGEIGTGWDHGPSGLLIPAGIVFVCLVLGLVYVARPAYVFDETYYFAFSTGVGKWFEHPTLDEKEVRKVFFEGNYHPPLPLYFMAITGRLFRGDVQDFLIATRLATVIQFALLALVAYLFIKSEAGTAAGLFAAGLVALSPRLFGQALLATYDIPMTLMWVVTTIAFYKGMSSRGWAVASGFAFGLALLTKENALLLPLALWPWGLLFYRKKSLGAIISMCVIGPVVMYAGWPWLWLHPLANAWRYVTDKLQFGSPIGAILASSQAETVRWRHMIQMLYLGKVYSAGPPWHYPFVVTLLGMPLATLVGAAWATIDARRNGKEPLVGLLWWSICAQLLVFAFIEKPYDGDRLFLPVVALVAIAGGLGLYWLAKRARWAAVCAVILLILSPGAEFFIYAPYGMSYYTPVIGGLPGAEKLGMEVTYYGEAVSAENFAAINSRAREGDRVTFGPMFKNVRRMLDEFIRYGYLKLGSVPAAELGEWDYLIFVNRGGFIEAEDREALESGTVISENKLLGVTLVTVVEKRKEAGDPETATHHEDAKTQRETRQLSTDDADGTERIEVLE